VIPAGAEVVEVQGSVDFFVGEGEVVRCFHWVWLTGIEVLVFSEGEEFIDGACGVRPDKSMEFVR